MAVTVEAPRKIKLQLSASFVVICGSTVYPAALMMRNMTDVPVSSVQETAPANRIVRRAWWR